MEGENPHKRLWDPESGQEMHDSSDSDDNDGHGFHKGVVYRLAKGQLKILENGMRQYEGMAARASSRMVEPKATAVSIRIT